ncbi:MAG: 3-methyl-2-oxobutanoate hydroxymethyltransferase [Alphaproteobacteria bacterium]|nr:3-methyl-2-oxobutanoate hydroxymethyltransferase [Alphaproteobacteria bacterium]
MKSVCDFSKMKRKGQKISMVTCYDYTSACIVSQSDVDCILVGDSLAMTMHGHDSTVMAVPDMMALHTAAVKRGAPETFIVGDMPFLSYRKSLSESIAVAGALMQAGAQAVKLEGAAGNTELVTHLVQSGIPVMGHIGLTPQFVHQIGGYKVQGKSKECAARLKEEARALEEAGCFALVMECVPASLAEEITKAAGIATIGIGAGRGTDGQVLVWQDMLGLNTEFQPKFVRRYTNGAEIFTKALNDYVDDVQKGAFPADENCFWHRSVA